MKDPLLHRRGSSAYRARPPRPLPVHLCLHLEKLERLPHPKGNDKGRKIAVFDLDDTLIVGDIGDAVLAQMILDGEALQCTWEDYQRASIHDPIRACRLAVTAMSGVSVETLGRATQRVLAAREESLLIGGCRVPIPKANSPMRHLVLRLSALRYELYVISASNILSARMAARHFFDIPHDRVYGVESRVVGGLLTADILEPVPVEQGKADVYAFRVGRQAPLITAGDSVMDLPMLNLTDPRGMAIWAGEGGEKFENVRASIDSACRLYRIPPDANSKFEIENSRRREAANSSLPALSRPLE